MTINKKYTRIFNICMAILIIGFMTTLFLSKGSVHFDCITLIPIFIFLISILYLSFYIFKDCKDNNFNGPLYSIGNILLSPFLIGLICYLFKRRAITKESNEKVLFKIVLYVNIALSMFSSLTIFAYIVTDHINNRFFLLICSYIFGSLLIVCPILFVFALVSLIIFIAFKVTKYAEAFRLNVLALLILINTTPIIITFIGLYFWVCI